jgi:hypothetical protein
MGAPFLWLHHPLAPSEEKEVAHKVWGKLSTRFRSTIPAASTVFARYGNVPNPFELEAEFSVRGSKCINPAATTKSISEFDWYHLLTDANLPTPRTWFEGVDNFQDLKEGSYVVKGKTNSRKWNWKTHMFAPNLYVLDRVRKNLYDDPFIAEQGLVVREFVPLESFAVDLNGMPVTNEWRFFFLNGKEIAGGFYWANWIDELQEQHPETNFLVPPPEALECARRAAKTLPYPFVAIDVARVSTASYGVSDTNSPTEVASAIKWDDGWMVVEVNDGCMSGLCTINPEAFYLALRKATMGW